ncbi:tRNA (adenosine(37)-N6)-threonylcarbamoyltransferase complex dimerization subunit type 1 TsaB [Ottowia sp. GY511]|uniref:tRNA (Adenosine(37)-N6)-threonylcarbamoyltransferase complex dimerization subunit type 1 TsaB n=1 Tax=Ottowia flava TaxID=2675430 RepID=A0ABW4KQI4_9BURK|nr:tRNA (adenosine(37)-N6)-threonylcarbamoyltransferase complex dimerization subunit type 1 TsaB [Ottowia sp. GY511]TXK33098.1 tRNA (adenosine(37)-N6)-threonylcarbamoyltransferase complex dimerization subunit type 1 TsaB [Ottowia sp. GY511]
MTSKPTTPLRLLAFDTSTDRLSVAVQHGDQRFTQDGEGGAQSSATLIPMVRALLAQADLSLKSLGAIVFGRGPGSFTGLRTACAVAQGFAYGAGVPVLPVDTLLAVAQDARTRHGATQVLALLDARMNELYSAAYQADNATGAWQTLGDMRVAPPEALQPPAGATAASGWVLAGNAFAAYGDRLPAALADWPRLDARPTASALLDLAPPLLAAGGAVDAAQALPLYIRDKVAQTTAERLANGGVR